MINAPLHLARAGTLAILEPSLELVTRVKWLQPLYLVEQSGFSVRRCPRNNSSVVCRGGAIVLVLLRLSQGRCRFYLCHIAGLYPLICSAPSCPRVGGVGGEFFPHRHFRTLG